ncbi:ABC transporter ATP-binding protein [Xylanimonas ulmi]|uniref:ABC-2 type transport system ATP-binding protein n=1 Tax=Xylanimonas ulmi TaxID=228973 RepID=A0A4Q7M492_9MICO|nr:ABC transporter ATP-binding protein [Xylanibacterium ulmi]RZS61318.1 ABC-2 type transport system ATP-binding protein [Xylanibacterium ulmi]
MTTPVAARNQIGAEPPLVASGLVRRYRRSDALAVSGVDLTIEAGEIVTLLGPNGAGKTTTVKMCSGLLMPTAGSVRVSGRDPYRRSARAMADIGLVLGGDGGFYKRATATANLLYFADLAGVPARERHDRAREVLADVGLTDRAGSKVNELSRGMVQRLHIARGLLARPRLLLLDEPTNGLDPEHAQMVRRLVRSLSRRGVGILLTTHYLTEAEELSDRLIVLRAGRVRAEGHVADLARAGGLSHVTTFALPPGDPLAATAAQRAGVDAVVDVQTFHGKDHVRLQWRTVAPSPESLATLEEARARALDYTERPPTLEENYLALVAEQPGVTS